MDKIAILDFGAQYTKVIDRRVREFNIQSEILPSDTFAQDLKDYDSIIISGGPHSVFERTAPLYDPEIFSMGKPILGICYGMQLMNQACGGKVSQQKKKEYGETIVDVRSSKLFRGLRRKEQVLMSHGDSITEIAKGFRIIATSKDIIAAIENKKKRLYGVQFHPEVDLTTNGKKILSNFLFKICKLKPSFTLHSRIENTIREIKKRVGKRNVLVLVSGGVDSAVTAALLLRALPKNQVYAIHIDHGFMRKNESKIVCDALRKLGLNNLQVINAKKEFSNAKKGRDKLSTTIDPETKRNLIGDTFIKIVDRKIEEMGIGKDSFIAQGTLRPDLIESASSLVSGTATKIKTHHNDSKLVREKREKDLVIEPNKDMHKDEVRKVGRLLGLPKEIVERHPFPGPGLAVRIICAKKAYTKNIERVNKRVKEIAREEDFNATILPIKTVGVQGDHRSYSYVAVLSGVGNWTRLRKIAAKIPQEVHEINRVVYIFEREVNGRINKITKTMLTPQAINQLQEADAIVNKKLEKYGLMKKLSQVPVISIPIGFGKQRSIALRPFVTNDFMTGTPARFGKDIPIPCLKEIVRELHSVKGIGAVMYDLTSKPPATTEWE